MGNFENLKDSGQSPSYNRPKVRGLNKSYSKNKKASRVHDPLIIERLNQYLNENQDQTYVDITVITEALRRRYREYRRRSWSDFRKLVERAFSQVSKAAGFDVEQSSSESSSEVEECNENDTLNTSNSQVMELYRNQQKKPNDMELINLSSSSDDGEPSNGMARSRDDYPGVSEEVAVKLRQNRDLSVSKRRHPTPRLNENPRRNRGPGVMSKTTFADFGGNSAILEEVCKLILHLKNPEVFRTLGVNAPRGFLLHGPPGCGKTLLASAIAGELKLPFIKVSGPELVGGVSGESEERVRELFTSALECAPCILFIDEVDAVTPNRQTAQREMERRIVAQLLTSLDDLASKDELGQVLVIGATKRPDALDPALRRAGRFDREVCLGIPDEKARLQILEILCAKVPLSEELNLSTIARMTPGFVGADLLSLIRESALVAITRVFEQAKKEKMEKKSRKRKLSPESSCPNPKRLSAQESPEPGVKTEDITLKAENNGDIEVKKPTEESDVDMTVRNGDAAKEQKTDDVVKETESTDNMSVDVDVDVVTAEPKPVITPEEDEEVIVGVESEDESKVFPKGEGDSLTTLLEWVRGSSSTLKSSDLRNLKITQDDLSLALRSVQPSAKREGFATVPGVTWEDIGSLVSVRQHLKMTILGPVKYQSQFERLGLVAPAGVLLCGPPGCGKTLLAKAVANEAGINFISVKGPELLNMYVGESERAVRTVFQRARNSAPCVIFFDELDALCPRRNEGDAGAGMRVVNQMLTEMDGVGERRGVFLMAATNRPDIVDPAVLRPGRLDKTIYIGLPSAEDRKDILRAITKNGKKPPLAEDVSLDDLALRPELNNWSGADLAALMRESAMQAVRDVLTDVNLTSAADSESPKDIYVTNRHIECALTTVRPSISLKDLARYEEMRKEFDASPGGT